MKREQFFFPVAILFACAVSTQATAQSTRPANGLADNADSLVVTRMMRFDVRHDGKLTRDEITDDRLLRLFDEADANKDGIVTRDELIALAAKLDAQMSGDSGGPGGGGGGMGRGGPGGFGGRDGFGGPGGFGGPPQPGQVLPRGLQQRLGLTDEQKSELAKLQSDVDARLGQILTAEQKQQMQQMAQRGPGGPGGFGGPPGMGGQSSMGGPPNGGGPGDDQPPPQ